MTKLKNLLRLYASGMGIRSISSTFHISRNTLRKYVRKYQESGLSMDHLLSFSDEKLADLLLDGRSRNRPPSTRRLELEALVPDYVRRLSKKGVSILSLHAEYLKSHPDGYKYSNFKRAIHAYRYQTRAVGHVEHLAGDQMYIDYAGNKLEIVEEQTGKVRSVEVFVAILPCSHYTYCEAVWSQKKEDLIVACENALHFFGGVPNAIVPDNLKSAVTRSDRNEPIINDDFAAMAEFYAMAVYPARVRRPKDKALVENAVKLMYRSIYVDIEGQTFHDIESLNAAIRISLEAFNSRRLSGRKESRLELFEEIEKDFLRPLPTARYQMKSRKTATVMGNSFVMLGKHSYSVPTEYIGKRMELIYDNDNVEIYHGLKLVTIHQRDDTPYTYSQKDAHNLPGHHGSFEKDLEEIYQRAGQIDNILLLYLKEVATQMKYPPKAFRSCRGIMSLEKKYGMARLVATCSCASEGRRYGYNDVKDILQSGDDTAYMPMDDELTPEYKPQTHKNIRGKDYFSKQLCNNNNNNKQLK
ncbi:MAG: IS21 family transposase [Phocaeicola sp.]|uniref:IS21 family transposase n=1 Tax=Phocaeicola sp. TaxID=2773926 RepID=UPI003FA17480